MRKYSDFYKTLHDEQGPTGYLGRGTHYSILRAVVFHNTSGDVLPYGQHADFAIIWDEDHDDRVIEPVEKIYRAGLLSRFLMFGERKGCFTAVAPNQGDLSWLEARLNSITQNLASEDSWPSRVVTLDTPENPIINADGDKVELYLNNLVMLWELGVKEPSLKEMPSDPLLHKKVGELALSIRVANTLARENIVYVGELVQLTEAVLLRMPNMGRTGVREIEARLAELNLGIGMEVAGWPLRGALPANS
jgi:hypothetical protein